MISVVERQSSRDVEEMASSFILPLKIETDQILYIKQLDFVTLWLFSTDHQICLLSNVTLYHFNYPVLLCNKFLARMQFNFQALLFIYNFWFLRCYWVGFVSVRVGSFRVRHDPFFTRVKTGRVRVNLTHNMSGSCLIFCTRFRSSRVRVELKKNQVGSTRHEPDPLSEIATPTHNH